MFRLLAFALAILASMTTLAQTTYDPKIAYTSFEKNADNLYVANADGSKRVSVYKISKARLGAIDMAPVDPLDPTARKIAFTQAGVLKLLRFKVLPTSIAALSVVTLDSVGAPYQGANFPDFSPDGSKILYIKNTPNSNGTSPTDVYLISSDGTNKKLLWRAALSGGTGSTVILQVRWTGSSEFAFMLDGSLSTNDIRRAFLDSNNNVVDLPLPLFTAVDQFFIDNYLFGIEDFDVARTRKSLIFTTGTPPSSSVRTIVEYALPDGSIPGAFSIRRSNSGGWKSHFSSDDSHILYLRAVSGSYTNFDAVYTFATYDPNSAPDSLAPRNLLGSLLDSLP